MAFSIERASILFVLAGVLFNAAGRSHSHGGRRLRELTMKSLTIVGLCVLATITYGIVHDQITARVCVEYFTIGHPPVFGTENPTLLGLGWGVLATWWVGLLLGVPLAVSARWGKRPKREVRSLTRPVAILMLTAGACALMAGVVGWWAADTGMVVLVGSLAQRVPPQKHTVFIADLWAHLASYGVGFLGGIVVIVRVWRSRLADHSRASPHGMPTLC